jgi:hypothetical protein
MALDVPDMVAKVHGVSRGHRYGAQYAISHGEVLCVAEDETSVDIMVQKILL